MKRIAWLLPLCLLLLTACGQKPAEETLPATMPTEYVEETAAYGWWAGDWYGWWCMYDTSGRFAAFENQAWDVCAVIEVAENAPYGHIRIWDDVQYEFGVLVNCDVQFTGDGRGRMISQDGSFFHSGADWEYNGVRGSWAPIENGQWIVDPEVSSVCQFHDMLEITGTYIDPENEEDAFGYRIYLRPWGYWWEDVLEGDISDCWYTDMMPVRYEDWYIPLLEMNEENMPGSFAIGDAILKNNQKED